MTTPPFVPLLSAPIPKTPRKKRVLLIDTSDTKRDLRAEVMRKLGMDVDCAADITEARCWWKADLYDLVLINASEGKGHRDKFCEEIRTATPVQQFAFLVGKPQYLSDSPSAEEAADAEDVVEQALPVQVLAGLRGLGDTPQRWGILEASRRISAVRSASVARAAAIRKLPAPPRDAEGRVPYRQAAPTPTPMSLDDLLKEEMR